MNETFNERYINIMGSGHMGTPDSEEEYRLRDRHD